MTLDDAYAQIEQLGVLTGKLPEATALVGDMQTDIAPLQPGTAQDGPPVTSIRVLYADLHGVARGKDVPISEFDHVMETGLCFCSAVMGTDLRHTPIPT